MATTPEAAIIGRLKAVSAVNTAVGGRVTPQLNTQEFTLPLIVVQRIGQTSAACLDGQSAESRYAIRVDLHAETEAAGAAIWPDILAAFDGWRDPDTSGVHGAFVDDGNQDVTEDPTRVWSQTFGVWWANPA